MRTRSIAVLVDLESRYGQSIVRGVTRYIRAHTPGMVLRGPESIISPLQDVAQWHGDGIIAQIANPEIERFLGEAKASVVNISHVLAETSYPTVRVDNLAVGRLVADYFVKRGFRNLAYCGYTGHAYSLMRGDSFVEASRKHGREVIHTLIPGYPPRSTNPSPFELELRDWIRQLPQPVGILACNDVRARQITQACLANQLRVPEDVAVVGVDNDELICETNNPPLSSVDVSAEQIGYQAAALLDRAMDGQPAPGQHLLVPPTGVVERQSSQLLAVTDPLIAQAIQLVNDHAGEPITVDTILSEIPLSRRALERRFRSAMGRTLYNYILERRIDRAKSLLVYSDLPASAIAERSGFSHTQQFNATFKRLTGTTPSAYRRRYRDDSLALR